MSPRSRPGGAPNTDADNTTPAPALTSHGDVQHAAMQDADAVRAAGNAEEGQDLPESRGQKTWEIAAERHEREKQQAAAEGTPAGLGAIGKNPAKKAAKKAPADKAPAAKAPAAKAPAAKAPAAKAPAAKAPAAKAPAEKSTTAPATKSVGKAPTQKAPGPKEPPVNAPAADPVEPSTDELEQLLGGAHHMPHAILGAHPVGGQVRVRALVPDAHSVAAVVGDDKYDLPHLHGGIWSGMLPMDDVPDYRLEARYGDGVPHTVDDPYRFLPTLGELDLHLIGEGRHEYLWEVLGSRVRHYDSPSGEIVGTSFAVWAPNALGVRVIADFNGWNGRAHPMRSLGSSGVWELFVPGIGAGSTYKYSILGKDGQWREKADPMAFGTEHPPATGSVVVESGYAWNDAQWLERRAGTAWHAAPMSIYEVHLGSWRQGLSYVQLADELTEYVQQTGYTHVELLPVAEHPFGGSWGYQVSGYYAPSSRFGSPDDFRYLVDRLHQAGIGVIVDWVPAHFPKDSWSLGRFDGTALYEHPDPSRGEQPDWGTYVFDFGRAEVRNFLVANALFWLEQFHVDGLRVDAVASMLYLDYSRNEGEWTPNVHGGRENLEAVSFLQEMNATVYKRVPGAITIAEESTAWPGVTRPTHLGGLGFGFKWNMGWMHDSLDYASREPVYRSYHHHQMTFSLVYAFSENYVLPYSHDEVVHGKGSLLRKMPGDRWQQMATLRALYGFMWAHPGKQLLYMGQEFAQESEWSEGRSLDWYLLDTPDHGGVHRLVTRLNEVYRGSRALYSRDNDPEGFSWIDANDAGSNVFSFVRRGDDGSLLVCITNFSGQPHSGYRVGLPHAGDWLEVVNTDAEAYGGSGVGNYGRVTANDREWHGRPASVELTVPPLATVWLVPHTGSGADT